MRPPTCAPASKKTIRLSTSRLGGSCISIVFSISSVFTSMSIRRCPMYLGRPTSESRARMAPSWLRRPPPSPGSSIQIAMERGRAGLWPPSKRSRPQSSSSASNSRRSEENDREWLRSCRESRAGSMDWIPTQSPYRRLRMPLNGALMSATGSLSFEHYRLSLSQEASQVIGFWASGRCPSATSTTSTASNGRWKESDVTTANQTSLIFAVLLMSPVDDEDIEGALLGRIAWRFDPEDPQAERDWVRQRNGFWMKGAQARGTRVSAVITGTNLMPWTVAMTWPRLWPNPWATRPLSADLPLSVAIADDRGSVTYRDRDDNPAELFGLPRDWPGPEDRFERA